MPELLKLYPFSHFNRSLSYLVGRYVFGVVFNGLTLGLNSEAWGLTQHCGLLHGHNVYSLSLVLVTGELMTTKANVF